MQLTLREHYEPDAEFGPLSEKLTIKMEAELAAIDKVLDDDELYNLIKQGFREGYPKTGVFAQRREKV